GPAHIVLEQGHRCGDVELSVGHARLVSDGVEAAHQDGDKCRTDDCKHGDAGHQLGKREAAAADREGAKPCHQDPIALMADKMKLRVTPYSLQLTWTSMRFVLAIGVLSVIFHVRVYRSSSTHTRSTLYRRRAEGSRYSGSWRARRSQWWQPAEEH